VPAPAIGPPAIGVPTGEAEVKLFAGVPSQDDLATLEATSD